ncbi:MAG: DUF1320 domain-containing protein [Tannerellaceae bacterium]|jgi:phage gp36-like protein|nr:DUF1320 domain-containing protein [Tannerellaceae bacterium]
MFLTRDDYIVVGDSALKVLQQSSDENRGRAEDFAREEISGYLRSRYDVGNVFSVTGDERNPVIVMYMCDIALYHMVSWLPQRMGWEIREIRYKRAIEWLKDVQAGKTSPDILTITGPDGEEDYNNPVRYNPGERNRYNW